MKPRVAVSRCLLGEHVRYDGGHKHSALLTEVLSAHFEWTPVCPEVDVGMGTPREPICLLAGDDGVRLVGIHSGRDWTDEMAAYAEAKVAELTALNIDGFILKKDSPSCGLMRVERHRPDGDPTRDGVGAFTRVLVERMAALPVEEEDRLEDAERRRSFIERVQRYHRRRAGSA